MPCTCTLYYLFPDSLPQRNNGTIGVKGSRSTNENGQVKQGETDRTQTYAVYENAADGMYVKPGFDVYLKIKTVKTQGTTEAVSL